jgi:tRNA(fMet)-specific endonuclease VapC
LSVLLDTNACVAAINSRPIAIRQRLLELSSERQFVAVSIITVFELHYGVAKSMQIGRNSERLDKFLTSVRVLPFDADDARLAGDIRADLERHGRPIGPYDYLIAAQALRRNLTVVTANVREFSRVKGLRWENWAE